MEPISLSLIAANSVVSYLAGKAFDKAFDTATEEFTKGSISWLKTIFFKPNGEAKTEIINLKENPEDELNQESAVIAIRRGIRNNPEAEKLLLEIAKVIESKQSTEANHTSINYSKNVNTGSISSGGNVVIGDTNTK